MSRVNKVGTMSNESEISSSVTVLCKGNWNLGYVREKNIGNEKGTINFMHPHGFNPFFVYPRREDTLHA